MNQLVWYACSSGHSCRIHASLHPADRAQLVQRVTVNHASRFPDCDPDLMGVARTTRELGSGNGCIRWVTVNGEERRKKLLAEEKHALRPGFWRDLKEWVRSFVA